MKKRIVYILFAILMAATTVLSCIGCTVVGSHKGDDDVDADHNVDADVKITVGTLVRSSEKNLMQTWINEFQKLHKNVSIEISKTYTTMEALIQYKTANELPDICWTAGDQHAFYSEGGYFQDLSDESVFEGSAAFFEGFYDAVVATTHYNNNDSGIWFVPRDYNRLTIFLNKTAFERMDIPLPEDGWTWDEFMDTCKKLVEGNNGVKCLKAIEWADWAPIYTTIIENFGASYIDDDGYFALNTEEGRAAYEWYEDFYDNYAVKGTGTSFQLYSNTSNTISAAMLVDTYANIGNYMRAADNLNWSLETVSFPAYTDADNGKGYVGAGCSGYAITSSCTDTETREWAWEFLKWCMSQEGYDKVADLGVVCPALKSMRNSGEWTTYGQNGVAINYHAFVDDSTEDIDLNYQNVLSSTSQQNLLIGMVDSFWKNVGSTSFDNAVAAFKSSYEGTIKKKV